MVPEQDSRNARPVEKPSKAPERKAEPPAAQLKAGKNSGADEHGLGHMFVEARKARGLAPEDVTREARIPNQYLKMIESDSYERISDQLYLLPFLRRYAAFLKIDPEEVAGRFLREVQRADSYAIKIMEPIPVAEPAANTAGRTWLAAALGAGVTIAVIAIAFLAASMLRRTGQSADQAPARAAVDAPSPGASAPVAAPIAQPPQADTAASGPSQPENSSDQHRAENQPN